MVCAALIQARAGSQRLPGKVLREMAGLPLLAHTIRRAGAASRIDRVVVATSVLERDDPVAELAERECVAVHRGSEDDVLSRMLEAAHAAEADAVVRLTADCPLLDPAVIDRIVAALVDGDPVPDYASNVIERTFPKGLDCEALWTETLSRIDSLATSREAREHVTWLAYRERPELFRLASVTGTPDGSALDWSVDTLEDFDRIGAVMEHLRAPDEPVAWQELAARSGL